MKKTITFFILSICISVNTLLAQQLSLVFPKNNFVTDDTCITFQWDGIHDADFYQFQIATDSLFQAIYIDSNNIYQNSLDLCLNLGLNYFWKFRYHTNSYISIWSRPFSFSTFTPNTIDSLILWFSSTDGVLSDSLNNITLWKNQKDSSSSAFQVNTSLSPQLQDSSLLTFPSINFSNSTAFLKGNYSLNQKNNSMHIISVATTEGSSQEILFSMYKPGIWSFLTFMIEYRYYHFIAYKGNDVLTESVSTNSNMKVPTIIDIDVDTNNNVILRKNGLVTNSAIMNKSSFQIPTYILGGRTNNGTSISRGFSGNLYEFLQYSKPLDSSEIYLANKYILDKYTPPINLGSNILLRYSLCDTILTTTNMYENYTWSTNDTTRSISINMKDTGWYWCDVPNLYGNIMRDSVYVYNFVPDLTIPDSSICQNIPTTLHSGFDHRYNFIWFTPSGIGGTDSIFTTSNPGKYWVDVFDTLGCWVSDTFYIKIDSFAAKASLGPDLNFCAGNKIGLISAKDNAMSYLWSTNSTDSVITINSPGIYYVTVTDSLGCIAIDSINITIKGIAPHCDFEVDSVCLGVNSVFVDSSYTTDGSNLVFWNWDFGDTSTSSVIGGNISHLFPNPGTYNVLLTVETDSGCANNFSKTTFVYPLPSPDFQPLNACSGKAINFSDSSISNFGQLNNWTWNFNDTASSNDTSSLQNPTYTFNIAGTYYVKLITTSNVSCIDSVSKQVIVRQSPQADFNYSQTCFGDTTWFFDNSITPIYNPITSWRWDFPNNKTSFISNPKYLFADSSGQYYVNLRVRALNGCESEINKAVVIDAIPKAGFYTGNLCKNILLQFTDTSKVENSSIVYWYWSFDTLSASLDQNPKYTFPDTGIYSINLIVSSIAGCKDTIIKNIKINRLPESNFSFDPEYGEPPLTVNFTNTSNESVNWFWNFADGSTSSDENPSHIFLDSGIFYVSLLINNKYGCPDSNQHPIFVIYSPVDIAVVNVYSEIKENYISFSADLINLGTQKIKELYLLAKVNGENAIKENWSGLLLPGENINYKFNASYQLSDASSANFICVKAIVPGLQNDVNHDNDEFCKSIKDAFIVNQPYPNPVEKELILNFILPYNDKVEIQLFDSNGNYIDKVFSENCNKGLNTLKLDLSTLNSGLYSFRLIYRDQVEIRKFVKY